MSDLPPNIHRLINDVRSVAFKRTETHIVQVKAAGDYVVWREAEFVRRRWKVLATGNTHMNSTVEDAVARGLLVMLPLEDRFYLDLAR